MSASTIVIYYRLAMEDLVLVILSVECIVQVKLSVFTVPLTQEVLQRDNFTTSFSYFASLNILSFSWDVKFSLMADDALDIVILGSCCMQQRSKPLLLWMSMRTFSLLALPG